MHAAAIHFSFIALYKSEPIDAEVNLWKSPILLFLPLSSQVCLFMLYPSVFFFCYLLKDFFLLFHLIFCLKRNIT